MTLVYHLVPSVKQSAVWSMEHNNRLKYKDCSVAPCSHPIRRAARSGEAYLLNQKSLGSNWDFIKEALQGEVGEDYQIDL